MRSAFSLMFFPVSMDFSSLKPSFCFSISLRRFRISPRSVFSLRTSAPSIPSASSLGAEQEIFPRGMSFERSTKVKALCALSSFFGGEAIGWAVWLEMPSPAIEGVQRRGQRAREAARFMSEAGAHGYSLRALQ